ncbi:MAG: hypothetical protein IH901_06385 [Proteobacteria bacterium]|nr:hypothetical protein [Pseudomonadota bacterium]
MVSRGLKVLFMVTIFLVVFTAMKKLPGQSGADKKLQRAAFETVMIIDYSKDTTCEQRKIVNTEIIDYPKNPGKDPWTERWTVDRCGKLVFYKVEFTPSPGGGTDIHTSDWK